MLGRVSQSLDNTEAIKQKKIDTIMQELEGIKAGLERLQSQYDSLEQTVTTNKVEATAVEASSVSTNAITTNSLQSDTVAANAVTADDVTTQKITADSANIDDIEADTVTADNLFGQIRSLQSDIQAANASITELQSQSITTEELTTARLQLQSLEVSAANIAHQISQSIQSQSIIADTVRATSIESPTVEAEEVTTDAIQAKEAEIDSLTAPLIQADTIDSTIVSAHALTGTATINLDPPLQLENDYYLLKIKKDVKWLHLSVADSFDITMNTAFSVNNITNGTALVLSHQKTMKDIVLYSMDNDYFYIEVSPTVNAELTYKYIADEEVPQAVTVEYNGHPEYEWYYAPEKLSEVIVLGDSTAAYQMNVLGMFKASLYPITVDTYEFQSIQVNKNIYVKDYFDEVAQQWVYKHGDIHDYLSVTLDYVDEQGIPHTRVNWRNPINYEYNTDDGYDENEYIVEDEQEVNVLDSDGNVVGKRTIPANEDTLINLRTLYHWNGEYTDETVSPTKVFHQTRRTPYGTLEYNPDTHDYEFIPAFYITYDSYLDPMLEYAEQTSVITGAWDADGNPIDPDDVWWPMHPWVYSDNIDLFELRYRGDEEYYIPEPGREHQRPEWEDIVIQGNYYPITKLGTVTHGKWEAGSIHTPHIRVQQGFYDNDGDGLIDTDHLKIEDSNFQMGYRSGIESFRAWDYANDNLDWVEV